MIEPHVAALAHWLQYAWGSASGEQLLQALTPDSPQPPTAADPREPRGCSRRRLRSTPPLLCSTASAVRPWRFCIPPSPSSPNHSHPAATRHRPSAWSRGRSSSGAPQAPSQPESSAAQVGCLRVRRAVLASLQPPISSELAPQLVHLESHLPTLIDVADELIRPVMLLYDWYILQDRLIRACGGNLVSERGRVLELLFEGWSHCFCHTTTTLPTSAQ